jgi:phospholipid transport system transporter-binding protein
VANETIGQQTMTLGKDTVTGVLTISGTLDIASANSLRETLFDCLMNQTEIAADLSGVDGCDAAGLQVLLAGLRDAAADGKTLRLTAVPHAVRETAAALGFPIPERLTQSGEERPHAG